MSEAGIAPSWVLPKTGPDEYMQRLGFLPLAAQPAEMFLYNNGLDVAGIFIERATGRRLAEVIMSVAVAQTRPWLTPGRIAGAAATARRRMRIRGKT